MIPYTSPGACPLLTHIAPEKRADGERRALPEWAVCQVQVTR